MKNTLCILQKHSNVGIVAPSSPFERRDFDDSINFLQNLGFVPSYNGIVFSKVGYLAGSDRDRAKDFLQHLRDPDIRAIFCARGGYGSMRMFPYFGKNKITVTKPIMGYSDVTAIQLYLYKKTRQVTFYGPNVTGHSFKNPQIFEYLTGNGPYNKRIKLEQLFTPYKAGTRIKGRILGGCLSIIASMIGTGFLPSFKGSILFIEDTNEAPYRIDRLMTQLIMSKTIIGIKAIVVGSMKNCESDGISWKDTVIETGQQLKIPVLCGLGAGHEKFELVVPIGTETLIDLDTNEIIFKSPFKGKTIDRGLNV